MMNTISQVMQAKMLAAKAEAEAREFQDLVDRVRASLAADGNRIQIVQDESPLGICVQTSGGCEETHIEVSPPKGSYLIKGVRSFNEHDEMVEIRRITAGDSDIPCNAGSFNSAHFSLNHVLPGNDPHLAEHRGYYRVPWGTISALSPLRITFVHEGCFSVLPYLRWSLYGVHTMHHDQVGMPEPAAEQPSPKAALPTPEEMRPHGPFDMSKYPALPQQDRPRVHAWGIPRR